MNIDIPFGAEDRKRLAQALGSTWKVEEVAALLARAGASEILVLATGRTVPATLAEARAFRIFNLLQQGMSLSDAESLVAAIFKVPLATAKRMVNAAVARYVVELQQGLSGAIAEVLDTATWDEEHERWDIRMPPTFIRERILEAAGRLPFPDPMRAAGTIWRFPEETYQAVRKGFGLGAKPPKMTKLADEISSAFALLGLLLVFVIGYFAAFFPLTQDILERPAPEVVADRRALISRLRTYRILVEGVLLLTAATGVVVTPLTRRVLLSISLRGPFPTIEAGLLLIDLMLLALFAVTSWVWIRLGRRIRALRNQ